MEAEILSEILKELHELRNDVRWFREREEKKQQAVRDMVEDAARNLMGGSGMDVTTQDRTRALAAFIAKTKGAAD